MNRMMMLVSAVALGAGAIFVFDPKQGRTRRALARDQWNKFLNRRQRALQAMVTDFSNRSQGLIHEAAKSLPIHAQSNGEIEVTSLGEAILDNKGHLTPAACLVVGTLGMGFVTKGLWKRGMMGGILLSLGAGLIAKSFMDTENRTPTSNEPEPMATREPSKGERSARVRKAAVH